METKRELQRKILGRLREVYPSETDDYEAMGDGDNVISNLHYLGEHGLVRFKMTEYLSDPNKPYNIAITAKGIDFLEDDGGLGAILGTVTVKLHEDTLRRLIEAKVQSSDLPVEEKNGILKALREAPGETIRHLTTKLVDLGLENAPKALPLFQMWIQSGHS